MTEAEARRLAAQEGLVLLPADNMAGFKCVQRCSNTTFRATIEKRGQIPRLGGFATAAEAASNCCNPRKTQTQFAHHPIPRAHEARCRCRGTLKAVGGENISAATASADERSQDRQPGHGAAQQRLPQCRRRQQSDLRCHRLQQSDLQCRCPSCQTA